MAPGSPLLRNLDDDGFPTSVRLTSIYSQRDSLCPPLSCRLEVFGAPHLKNVEVKRGGHLGLLFSAEIPSIISRELESVQPTVQASRQLTVRRLISSTNDATERAVA